MKRILLLLLLAGLPFVLAWTQGLVSVKHYTSRDGLSQNMVQSILQDADGFIWMATWNGLEKFDGYSFTNYKSYPTDKVRLKHNRLINMAFGGKHTLLCQTYDYGLYLFDTRKECFEDIYAGNPDVKRCQTSVEMCPAGNGAVWILGEKNELWRIDCDRYAEKDGVVYFDDFVRTGDINDFSVLTDSEGREWVLTDRGYFVYGDPSLKGSMGVFQSVKVGGKLFFINEKRQLMSYVGSEHAMRKVVLPERLETVNQLLPLKDGQLGIVSQRGFTLYNTEKESLVPFFIDEDQKSLHPIVAFQDSKGDVWIQNSRRHIVHIDISSGEFAYLDYPHVKGRNSPCFIMEDEHGCIWAYPPDGVLSYYHPDKRIFEQGCVVNNTVKEVYGGINKSYCIDNHKNVWFCQDSGVDRVAFSDMDFDYIPTPDQSVVRGLYIDRSERLWIADKGNVVQVYDKDRVYCGNLSPDGKLVKDLSVKFGESVYAFFEDKEGNLWIGTRWNGLFIGVPDGRGNYRLKHYTQGMRNGLNCNAIYQIVQDALGRIWIATYGGGLNLAEGSPDALRFMNVSNRFARNYPGDEYLRVRTVCPLSNGVILVGTTGGLLSFSSSFENPEQIRFYVNRCETIRESSLNDNDVMHILETADKEIYIALFSGGISKVLSSDLLSDNVSFSHYNRKNGLSSDFVLSITEDWEKRLWIVLEDKICRFYPSRPEHSEVYDYFNRNSNLTFTEVPPCVDSEGKMYVGSNEGTLCFKLAQLKKSSYVPNLVFAEANIRSDKGIPETMLITNDTLLLKKDERNVTVSFTAIDFTLPSHIEYAYRIKDMGVEWIDLGKNHSVNFANLPAGDFELEVKSTNGDGVWTDNARVLHVCVKPTFWETAWAIVFYFGIFLLALVLGTSLVMYIWGLRKKLGFEKEMTNMKLRFFTDISHELRTPLTLIEAPIEEVLEREALTPEGKKNMQVAKRNTDRMLFLINQLLDFRKIQNNKMKLYIEQVDAAALLRKVYDDFRVMASASAIDFSFVSVQEEMVVYTDVDKLEKIVVNLVSNAFKYTPKGKKIRLTAEVQEEHLQIKVEDEGRGIDGRNISRLFERFETLGQNHSSFSTGIGLSLVYELVTMMHGTIEVATALGKGSEFVVSLPIKCEAYRKDKNVEFILNDGKQEAEAPGLVPLNVHDESEKEATLLVVEDNEELRALIVRILQHGYRVLEAKNGREGLEQAISEIPDVIISDVMMPEMDGIELLNEVKHHRDVCHVPVIILSAKASLEDRIKGLEYGADGYITKPFSSTYLLARIKSLLQLRENLKNFLLAENKLPSSASLSPSLPKITRYDEDFIGKILQSVEENIGDATFKIEDLADSMNMGRSMFYRKVKSILGCTPIDFVKDMRVKRAAQLLEMSEYTVSEVAYMCGFSSPQYFSRVFKAAKGCTPTEYKENIIQKEEVENQPE